MYTVHNNHPPTRLRAVNLPMRTRSTAMMSRMISRYNAVGRPLPGKVQAWEKREHNGASRQFRVRRREAKRQQVRRMGAGARCGGTRAHGCRRRSTVIEYDYVKVGQVRQIIPCNVATPRVGYKRRCKGPSGAVAEVGGQKVDR